MPVVDLTNVDVYQEKNLILSSVNLKVEKNEFVYLIGKVGSGKTSLIKTLNAELPVKSGNAKIGDFQLLKLKKSLIPKLRRNVGIVFQDFQLLNDRSVYDNLHFVLKATGWKKKNEIDQRIQEVMASVKLEDKLGKMPHQLSGGEQQRVVIARAMLNKPLLILADEPTGNLDPETSDEIMQLLIEISKTQSTVIMSTHNYQLIEKFPQRTLKCEDQSLMEVI